MMLGLDSCIKKFGGEAMCPAAISMGPRSDERGKRTQKQPKLQSKA
jgi:hypothetical protein